MIITDDKDKIIKAYKKEQVEYTNKFIDMQEEIERQKEIIKQLDIKNVELTTIIKEVREYLNNCGIDEEIIKDCKNYDVNGIDLLNILDKEKQ